MTMDIEGSIKQLCRNSGVAVNDKMVAAAIQAARAIVNGQSQAIDSIATAEQAKALVDKLVSSGDVERARKTALAHFGSEPNESAVA